MKRPTDKDRRHQSVSVQASWQFIVWALVHAVRDHAERTWHPGRILLAHYDWLAVDALTVVYRWTDPAEIADLHPDHRTLSLYTGQTVAYLTAIANQEPLVVPWDTLIATSTNSMPFLAWAYRYDGSKIRPVGEVNQVSPDRLERATEWSDTEDQWATMQVNAGSCEDCMWALVTALLESPGNPVRHAYKADAEAKRRTKEIMILDAIDARSQERIRRNAGTTPTLNLDDFEWPPSDH